MNKCGYDETSLMHQVLSEVPQKYQLFDYYCYLNPRFVHAVFYEDLKRATILLYDEFHDNKPQGKRLGKIACVLDYQPESLECLIAFNGDQGMMSVKSVPFSHLYAFNEGNPCMWEKPNGNSSDF